MAKTFEVKWKGVRVNGRQVTSTKGETSYTNWEVRDYSGGKLVRHYRTSLSEAKAKAREICECLAGQKQEVLSWDDQQRIAIQVALKALDGTGIAIERACGVVADASKLIPVDEILAACRAWHDRNPKKRLTAKKVKDAAQEYLSRRASGNICLRRYLADKSYLGSFAKHFGHQHAHEVTALAAKDFFASKGWQPRTRNAVLTLLKSFYNDAVERGYALENPLKAVKAERVDDTEIEIFQPGQVQRLLDAVEDQLKPFLALCAFSGLRKEEASRLTLEQVREGLRAGSIYVNSKIAKIGRARSVAIGDNCRRWLERYLPQDVDGMFLPDHWRVPTNLDHLGPYAAEKAGLTWVRNGLRHSYGTYHLRLQCDPGATVAQMGNSLKQLDRHYVSRSETVTPEVAREYFAIVPATSAEVIPLNALKAEGTATGPMAARC